MNPDDLLLAAEIQARAVMAQLEMQAMIATNQECEVRGETPAYHEESFRYVRDDLAALLDRHNMGVKRG
ncbi:MAG: hypothetical protein GY903_07520 [Fuerstiella sp.]|nr:hypothetical protein [Fuerstiella sp.]